MTPASTTSPASPPEGVGETAGNTGPRFLDFYFDFVSPYGYFVLHQIEPLAQRHGRMLRWHPFHMRAVTKEVLGMTQAMADVPLKGDYLRNDVRRTARYLGVPYQPAPAAGFSSVTASRVFYLINEHDPAAAARHAHAVFHSHHAQARSPNTWADCSALATSAGADPAWLIEREQAERGRELFRQATADAVAHGVWGTPSFRVDGEMFWGSDRLGQLDEWLRVGGW